MMSLAAIAADCARSIATIVGGSEIVRLERSLLGAPSMYSPRIRVQVAGSITCSNSGAVPALRSGCPHPKSL